MYYYGDEQIFWQTETAFDRLKQVEMMEDLESILEEDELHLVKILFWKRKAQSWKQNGKEVRKEFIANLGVSHRGLPLAYDIDAFLDSWTSAN